MSAKNQLIKLAIKNLNQVPCSKDRINILTEAAKLSDSEHLKEQLQVTAKCLFEADAAQLELIKEFSN